MTTMLLSVLSKIFVCLFGIIAIATLIWYLWVQSFVKYLKCFPQVPHMLPFLGHSLQISSTVDLYNKLKHFHAKLGEVFLLFVGPNPNLIIADPNLLQVLLTSQKYIDKSSAYKFLERYIGQGLITSGGQKWRSHRNIISPVFHVTVLQQFARTFDSTSDVLVKKLRGEIGKESTDIHRFMALSSFDSVCESMMGASVNSQENQNSSFFNSIGELTRIISERTMSVMEHYDCTYIFSKNSRREKSATKAFHDFTDSVIAKRREALASKREESDEGDNESKRKSTLLDFLLEYNKNGDTMSNEEIRDEIHNFLSAGSEATAALLTFSMYLLSKHPDVQDRVVEELKDLLGDHKDRKITYQDVQEMRYLDLVIKESLRMYPSAPMFARELHEDLIYGDTVIPKGVTTAIVPMLLHMDEKYFPNPGKFDPERFLPENSVGRHPCCYIPFSAGPRNCIGKKYAMVGVKFTLSKVLRNFELFPVKHEMVLAIEATLKSTNGVMLQIKARKW